MNKIWQIIGLSLLFVIIILPCFIYGYIYPNMGDDSSVHMQYIQALQQGKDTSSYFLYYGQLIIGYPIVWISNLTTIPVTLLFTWFNFIALWLVGVSVFLLIKKLSNLLLGMLASVFILFNVHSVLNLFQNGTIFDLLTVGVIVPLLLYSLLYGKKLWYISASLFILAIIFHSLGISYISGIGRGGFILEASAPFNEFISILLGYIPVIVLLMSILVLISKRNNLKIKITEYIVFGCLVCACIFLLILSVTPLTIAPYRFCIDLSICVGILIVYLMAIAFRDNSRSFYLVILAVIIGIGSVFSLKTYYEYNSVIKPLDKKVIEYVNSLEGDYYSCSPEVAYWVYDRYLNKQYKSNTYPFIKRSETMTPRTMYDNRYYWAVDNQTNYNMESLDNVEFKENDIVITVSK